MSEEVINRVDTLVRQNNIKYKDEQDQKAYEQALKQYQKHNQKEFTKHYASVIKEGNRKAIEKAKEARVAQKKKKQKKVSVPVVQTHKEESKVEPKFKKSEVQVAMFNKTVEARADRILQEQQLYKLNKKLDEEKKRTKLYQLNQKCKKMLSKSHERIVPARGVSSDKMEILKQMQNRAFGQIQELDNIINDLVDKANESKNPKRPHSTMNLKKQPIEEYQVTKKRLNDENREDQLDNKIFSEFEKYQVQQGQQIDHTDNLLSLNTLIFEKSTEELLGMNYLPI